MKARLWFGFPYTELDLSLLGHFQPSEQLSALRWRNRPGKKEMQRTAWAQATASPVPAPGGSSRPARRSWGPSLSKSLHMGLLSDTGKHGGDFSRQSSLFEARRRLCSNFVQPCPLLPHQTGQERGPGWRPVSRVVGLQTLVTQASSGKACPGSQWEGKHGQARVR